MPSDKKTLDKSSSSPHESPHSRRNKVTFKDAEESNEEETTEERPVTRKPGKAKFDIRDLDAGMAKLERKISEKSNPGGSVRSGEVGNVASSSSRAPHPSGRRTEPWEVDSSQLEIGKKIGHGTYGNVYKGMYNGQDVAIKMMEWGGENPLPGAELNNSGAMRKQYNFFREVEVMYTLDHPHICKFLGAVMGSTNFQVPTSPPSGSSVPLTKLMCCIVMEYVENGTLRQFWAATRRSGKRRMPFNVLVQFAKDIAEGLAYLHSKKVCHRDLKPDNILMTKMCRLKICDFGVSRITPDRVDDDMTMYVGTPNYTAPEVLDGSNQYTHKCDVYSYGVCLWEIYCFHDPYPGLRSMNSGAVNQAVINSNLRPPIPCCCPPVLKDIMTKCWAPNPSRRPEMVEVIAWLDAIDTSKPRIVRSDFVVESCACMESCMQFPSARAQH